MRTMYHEDLAKIEIRMRYQRIAREQEMDRLVQVATRNRQAAPVAAWALVAAGLTNLAERGAQVMRSALAGPSKPNEECC